jgi:hypothetical protein
MMVMERRRDELAAAQQAHLVRQMRLESQATRENRPQRSPWPVAGITALFLARCLSGVGDRLLTWSCRLEVRYAGFDGKGRPASSCGS